MSKLYNRQVAQTRNARPADSKQLQLQPSELGLLVDLLQREELAELEQVQSSHGDAPPFRLMRLRALLQKCQSL